MAIAGWLMIGLALLVIVAVVNNSWQPLFDQFRQAVSGPGAPGKPAQPAQQKPAADTSSAAPVPFAQSGIPEGTSRGLLVSSGGAQPDVGAGTGVEAVPVP